ncbi:phosphate-starvation-inducible PsiE family protein [Calothrix sp. FACHB-1219]|uniref:phosphate-starvation-inducible PsiE family protein n=1 Tax=unclassified Calothrix TaxID=2619626 RepID=UPI00168A1A25|nr:MULTISPECIES: phosphate-starvation-inducible PsiE family protein [unclassified Calothrix]MBD2205912.1 phosphate-starvation-inducible PsiE family protein [Calothrix sp. FACHB-168]MBD2220741.1 phosphate-starvation-inducible PsiE family protein [Calothrix sp. FACHB-1219]
MQKRVKSRFLFCDRWFDRRAIVQNMEAFQDLIVIILCLGLFAVMLLQLWGIFIAITQPLDYKLVTAKILFVLILVELFRLMMIYLQEHSIAVGVAVEVTIVSVLREVVVHGALEISSIQTAAMCGLLFILGGLLIVCAKTPHMDCMSANTKFCPIAYTGTRDKQNLEFHYSRQCEDNQQMS